MRKFTPETARRELNVLIARPELDADMKRRVAELYEFLGDVPTAHVWWARAAEAGDRDAIDMMTLIVEEKEKET